MRGVDQQIAALRPAIRFAAHMHTWLLAGAAVAVLAAVVFWHPVPLMLAVFLGTVGLSERRAGPNIVAAITAYDSAAPTIGEVSVTITCWSDNDHFHATARGQDQPDWEFEFIPQGWRPTARRYPARLWRGTTEGEPVLAVVDEGILIPRYAPKKLVGTDNPAGKDGGRESGG